MKIDDLIHDDPCAFNEAFIWLAIGMVKVNTEDFLFLLFLEMVSVSTSYAGL